MKYLFTSLLLLVLASCGNNTSESQPSQDSVTVDTTISEVPIQDEEIVQSTHPDTILVVRLADGKIHEYYQVYSNYTYNLHTRIKGEKKDKVIGFAYDRYQDGDPFYTDGFPSHINYVVSPDMKSIYVIGDIQANSNGWVTEYQIFKVDLETNKSKCIAECAAIEAVKDGFIVAQARLTNEETASNVADEIWVMHDEKIDFDGKVVNVSKKEYNYETMEKKFSSGNEYEHLKGFKSCTNHNNL